MATGPMRDIRLDTDPTLHRLVEDAAGDSPMEIAISAAEEELLLGPSEDDSPPIQDSEVVAVLRTDISDSPKPKRPVVEGVFPSKEGAPSPRSPVKFPAAERQAYPRRRWDKKDSLRDGRQHRPHQASSPRPRQSTERGRSPSGCSEAPRKRYRSPIRFHRDAVSRPRKAPKSTSS